MKRTHYVYANNPGAACKPACRDCVVVHVNHALFANKCNFTVQKQLWFGRYNPMKNIVNGAKYVNSSIVDERHVVSNKCVPAIRNHPFGPCRYHLHDDASRIGQIAATVGADVLSEHDILVRGGNLSSDSSISTGSLVLMHLCRTLPSSVRVVPVGFDRHLASAHSKSPHNYQSEWQLVQRACANRKFATGGAKCPFSGKLRPIRAEFGHEVAIALPYAWWLHERCNQRVKVNVCDNTSALWWFADTTISKCVRSGRYNRDVCSPHFGWSIAENFCHKGHSMRPPLAPDYLRGLKTRVADACPRLSEGKPILYVNNKYATEWGHKPVNYIPLTRISPLLTKFRVLYHRPDRFSKEDGRVVNLNWPDEANWLRQFNVTDISTNHATWGIQEQLCYMAQADMFVTSQGGGSRLVAVFRKPTVVWHMKGSDNYENIRTFSGNENIVVVKNAEISIEAELDKLLE